MSRFERTPGAALGPAILDALYADISESSAAASKWVGPGFVRAGRGEAKTGLQKRVRKSDQQLAIGNGP